MGPVWAAQSELIQRDVAIKVMRPEIARAPTLRRFFNEARICGSLRDPGILEEDRATARYRLAATANVDAALGWYRRACDLGMKPGCLDLARCTRPARAWRGIRVSRSSSR